VRLAELQTTKADYQATIADVKKQLGSKGGEVGNLYGQFTRARGTKAGNQALDKWRIAVAERDALQKELTTLQWVDRRLTQQIADIKLPRPATPQAGGRRWEKENVTQTGMPKNTRGYKTSFPDPNAPDGTRIPDYMPTGDPKQTWVNAKTLGQAEFIADSKLLGKTITLTQQLRGFIELAGKSKQKVLLLLTDPGAKVSDTVHDFARGYGVTVHLMTRPPGF
jgi:hypothetical protein